MELYNPLLIVVDPGHGGQDSGAVWGGRQEKDDNLRLGAALRQSLIRQGVEPLMTRDTDLFIPLPDRVNMANANNADLYVSLHRDFSPDAVAEEYGVQNSIYLTAPEPTTLCAATQVLNAIAEAGVQQNRGISRTNQYVLRRTHMPAMLLDMGFISNPEDNRLFDERLYAYAEAITMGILSYFGIAYTPPAVQPPQPTQPYPPAATPQPPQPSRPPVSSPLPFQPAQPSKPTVVNPLPPQPAQPPAINPLPSQPAQPPAINPLPSQPIQPPASVPSPQPSTSNASAQVRGAQQALNQIFGANIDEDGIYGPLTIRATVRAMQMLINETRGGSLAVDGLLGAATRAVLPILRQGDRGNTVSLLQILLTLHGYDPGNIDGIYGPRTRTAVTLFQRDHFLVPDGVAGPRTLAYLLR